MPRDCTSSATPRTVVIPERLMSSAIPAPRRYWILRFREYDGHCGGHA
jgi:hypothetical protein